MKREKPLQMRRKIFLVFTKVNIQYAKILILTNIQKLPTEIITHLLYRQNYYKIRTSVGK